MIRLFAYLFIFGAVLYFLSIWGKKGSPEGPTSLFANKSTKSMKHRFKQKPGPNEVWVQVFQTETLEDARRYQARIQEDDIACIIYEQGTKDIHGNEFEGIGIAVPKTSKGLAQTIVSRISI